MKKREIIAIGFVFLVALIVWGVFRYRYEHSEKIQVINQHGDILLEVPLYKDGNYCIDVKNGKFYLEVKDGSYRSHDVDCPDKVCEAVGWVNKESYMPIICLPNGIMVVLNNE